MMSWQRREGLQEPLRDIGKQGQQERRRSVPEELPHARLEQRRVPQAIGRPAVRPGGFRRRARLVPSGPTDRPEDTGPVQEIRDTRRQKEA